MPLLSDIKYQHENFIPQSIKIEANQLIFYSKLATYSDKIDEQITPILQQLHQTAQLAPEFFLKTYAVQNFESMKSFKSAENVYLLKVADADGVGKFERAVCVDVCGSSSNSNAMFGCFFLIDTGEYKFFSLKDQAVYDFYQILKIAKITANQKIDCLKLLNYEDKNQLLHLPPSVIAIKLDNIHLKHKYLDANLLKFLENEMVAKYDGSCSNLDVSMTTDGENGDSKHKIYNNKTVLIEDMILPNTYNFKVPAISLISNDCMQIFKNYQACLWVGLNRSETLEPQV